MLTPLPWIDAGRKWLGLAAHGQGVSEPDGHRGEWARQLQRRLQRCTDVESPLVELADAAADLQRHHTAAFRAYVQVARQPNAATTVALKGAVCDLVECELQDWLQHLRRSLVPEAVKGAMIWLADASQFLPAVRNMQLYWLHDFAQRLVSQIGPLGARSPEKEALSAAQKRQVFHAVLLNPTALTVMARADPEPQQPNQSAYARIMLQLADVQAATDMEAAESTRASTQVRNQSTRAVLAGLQVARRGWAAVQRGDPAALDLAAHLQPTFHGTAGQAEAVAAVGVVAVWVKLGRREGNAAAAAARDQLNYLKSAPGFWEGAGLFNPVVTQDGSAIVSESRRGLLPLRTPRAGGGGATCTGLEQLLPLTYAALRAFAAFADSRAALVAGQVP